MSQSHGKAPEGTALQVASDPLPGMRRTNMTALPLQQPPRPVRQWLVSAAGRRAGSVGAGPMARHSPVRGRATGLTGRRSERDADFASKTAPAWK